MALMYSDVVSCSCRMKCAEQFDEVTKWEPFLQHIWTRLFSLSLESNSVSEAQKFANLLRLAAPDVSQVRLNLALLVVDVVVILIIVVVVVVVVVV